MHPLADRLRELTKSGAPSDDDTLSSFLSYAEGEGLSLYPAQEEALLELVARKNVILATPTGSGKSLVAMAACFFARARKERVFLTFPIKALVSEKFFALCAAFGPDAVGMMTGDASVNRDAPIVCCTAEVLANLALREGATADVDVVVMDEFHYYSDRERGAAWQVPLLLFPYARFLLMSATLGDTTFFEKDLTTRTKRETALVSSTVRPVPLEYSYSEVALHEAIAKLVNGGKAPVYLVSFTQRQCAEEAQNLMSVDFCTKDEKKAIAAELAGVKFPSPYGKELSRFLRHGVAVHHAGLLPRYRLLVEKLSQKGLLKVICGTDTLGVGVNIPLRTVLFTKLCKYDGQKTAILSVRDFHQISGRAGRKGFDDRGYVVAQAPEHVIENLKLEAKAGNDPVKKKRIVRKKPPEKGYVHWDRNTFDKLVTSAPEPLVSRFSVSHGMLLDVLSRPRGGCKAMKQLLNDCHERPGDRTRLKKTALSLFRSLVRAGIIELVPYAEDARGLRVNRDLQAEFSLHQTLSLYLLDTIPRLDPEGETYALDLLTIVESILENPEIILIRQLDALKTEKMAEMKAAGVEYEERIAELDKMEYPKPHAEFIYATFNDFAKQHPWVGENIRPKSVARDMFERWQSFAEYVKEYDLSRSEGLLLRYLSDTYKVLVQTVPERARTPEVDDVIAFLGAVVRGTDASLLEEWEKMRDPSYLAHVAEGERPPPPPPPDVTRDQRAFGVLVRNELFRIVRALSRKDYQLAADLSDLGIEGWPAARFEEALRPFFAEHAAIRIDPEARSPKNTMVTLSEDGAIQRVTQVILDSDEQNDWVLEAEVDLGRSRAEGRPVVTVTGLRG